MMEIKHDTVGPILLKHCWVSGFVDGNMRGGKSGGVKKVRVGNVWCRKNSGRELSGVEKVSVRSVRVRNVRLPIHRLLWGIFNEKSASKFVNKIINGKLTYDRLLVF